MVSVELEVLKQGLIVHQRDYVLELIRQAVQFIAQAVGLAQNNESQQAKQQLNRAAIQLVGIDLDSVEELSVASIRMIFLGVHGFDVARIMVLGNLLKERGDLEEEGQRRIELHRKAKILLIDAAKASEDPLPVHVLRALSEISSPEELPPHVQEWIDDMIEDFGAQEQVEDGE
jgi:hypothetical protein